MSVIEFPRPDLAIAPVATEIENDTDKPHAQAFRDLGGGIFDLAAWQKLLAA